MGQILSQLTDLLRREKETMTLEWTSRLREDPKIPQAHGLSEDELRNHIPDLLDELVETLSKSEAAGQPRGASGPEIGSRPGAKEHAQHRVAHGYTLAAELREMAHLRAVFLELCTKHGVVLEGYEALLVHSLLDEIMITSALEMEETSTASLRRDVELRSLFTGIVSHDLRSPLSVIAMCSSVLLRDPRVDASLRRDLQRIAGNAARMQRLVEDLLDLTHVEARRGKLPIAPKPCDLRAIAEQTIEETRLTHPDCVLELSGPPSMAGVWDPNRLKQLLINLLTNALDHGEAGKPIDVALVEHGRAAELRVHNLGPPIPPELRSSLFDPFRRGNGGSRTSAGLGLGLFIVCEITRAHGGQVDVTSAADEGTTFAVSLPRPALAA